MKITFILLLLLPITLFAQQSPKKAASSIGENPIIIIDSIRMTMSEFKKFDPNTVALVTILDDSTKTRLFGDDAKDGAIIVETKDFARKQYIRYFRKVSAKYDSLYAVTKTDTSFQYIINGKVKKQAMKGNWPLLTIKSLFHSIF